jgi:hypothetical protein
MSNDTASRNIDIATTILAQLGGSHFVSMTGARALTACDSGLRLKLPGNMTRERINWMEVRLEPSDTYTVTFASERRPRGKAWAERKVMHTFEDVYCDQLRDLFEEVTGLLTSLCPRHVEK